MPSSVSLSQGPPASAYTALNDLAGGTNVVYSGVTPSFIQSVTLTGATVSKAAAGVVTFTAHGLASDNSVTISGGTGDWAALNGTRIITKIDADTFSVAVNTSGYSGTFGGTVTTNAPQTSAASWAVQKYYYDASGNVLRTAWAAGTSAMNQVWDNRASLSYL